MLTKTESKWVAFHGWTGDHDIALMTPVLGDPVLQGRLLLYLRDTEVHLCGWPLEGDLTLSEFEVQEVAQQAIEWGKVKLHIWGPTLVDLSIIVPEWRRWYTRVPREHDWLMRIDLRDYNEDSVRLQSNFRRAVRSNYKLVRTVGFPGVDIVEPLVSPYLMREDIPDLQKSIIRLASCPDLYADATTFLALRDDLVVGMEVCRELSGGNIIGTWALSRKSARGASDFLYMKCKIGRASCRERV